MLQLYMRSQISAEICLNWELANDAITEAVKGETFTTLGKLTTLWRGPAFGEKVGKYAAA